MKPSPDKLSQIADIHAVRSQSGERVPMGMKCLELLTETYRSLLKVDFHNTSLPEDITDHRLSESKLCSSLEMDLVDQECDSCESIAFGFVDCSVYPDPPPGKKWRMKRRINGEAHISLFESLKPDVAELANSMNEPPISRSYEGTTKPDLGSLDVGIHYHTYDPDPPDKPIIYDLTSYEDGMDYRDGTSEPPGITVRLLTTANPCPPGCISYSLSETLWGDHMQRVQEMESTLTISVSDGMLGMWNGKHSLSDYHLYPLDYITSYSLINHLTDFRQEKDSD
jgi:hypothetical protein